MKEVVRDDQFYMTLVTFQVEDCLFRVPRRLLESQSKVFQDMFSLPASDDTEGSNDSNPILLEGIKKTEFKRFLEVLLTSPLYDPPEPSPGFKSWIPVMKLARMWECNKLYKYAIDQMAYKKVSVPAVEKVALAFQHDIEPWILPGLNELAQRDEPVSVEDVKLLGLEVALKVAEVRESIILGRRIIKKDSLFERTELALMTGVRVASSIDFTPTIKDVFQLTDADPSMS